MSGAGVRADLSRFFCLEPTQLGRRRLRDLCLLYTPFYLYSKPFLKIQNQIVIDPNNDDFILIFLSYYFSQL